MALGCFTREMVHYKESRPRWSWYGRRDIESHNKKPTLLMDSRFRGKDRVAYPYRRI